MAAVGLFQACSAGPEASGLLHGLVSGIFENERTASSTPQVTPPGGPAPGLATMGHGERLLYHVGGAKDHGRRSTRPRVHRKRQHHTRNSMRAGVGGTGPVSQNEGFDRPLGTSRDARVVFVVKGLRSFGVFTMDLLGALVDGLSGVIVGNREVPGGAMR